MLALFSNILTKTDFEDEIQFKWGRVVTSCIEKFLILGLWTRNGSSKGLVLQGNRV